MAPDALPGDFHHTIEQIAEVVGIAEEFVLPLIVVILVFMIVLLTFLLTRKVYKSRRPDMSMSDEDRKRLLEEAENCMKYKRTPERPIQEPPKAEDLTGAFPSEEIAESESEAEERKSGTELFSEESAPLEAGETADSPVVIPSENLAAVQETAFRETDTSVPSSGVGLVDPSKPGIAVVFNFLPKESHKDWPDSNFFRQIKEAIDRIDFPVGIIGTPYEFEMDFSSLSGILTISTAGGNEMLSQVGLNARMRGNNRIVLSGTPREVPQEEIIAFVFPYFSNKNQPHRIAKPFLVNAAPQSLWKDIPVEDYDGYKNEDNAAQGVAVPRLALEVVAASVRGRSHAHVGKPRDDCFYMEFDEATGWNYVAVADGAGSAKFSRKGSEIACHAVIQSLRASLCVENTKKIFEKTITLSRWKAEFLKHNGMADPSWENEFVTETQLGAIFHKAVYDAHKAIEAESLARANSQGDAVLKDYHTTLLCAAFRFVEDLNSYLIASYWVGDGGAALFADNGQATPPWSKVLVLGEPDGGEFAGQTRFLTMPSEIFPDAIRKRLRFSFCDHINAMILVTDGITDAFFPSESAVEDGNRWSEFYEQKLKEGCEEEKNGCPVLDDAAASPQQKADALRAWLGFWSKGNHDDRTMLIVKPRSR